MQNKIFERNNQLQELIKELKNSSSELKKERDFHTALINNSSSAIIVLNNQYKIHNINDTVKVTYYRDGKSNTADVKLSKSTSDLETSSSSSSN